MGKKSNVHPDHYKTAGREPPGQGTVPELYKQDYGAVRAREGKETKTKGGPPRRPITGKGRKNPVE